jgi:uncharacterized protein
MGDTSKRGLGSDNMSEEQKRDIQSKGGEASPQNFKTNPDLASEAGREGGQKSSRND